MCCEAPNSRSVTLKEGHLKWLMELETPEERLAALETIVAMAFPKEGEAPYQPPEKPLDGSRLSDCDKARRAAYNIFLADIVYQRTKGADKQKSLSRSIAGKKGAMVRWGDSSTIGQSDVSTTESEPVREEVDTPKPTPHPSVPETIYGTYPDEFSDGSFGKRKLNDAEKEAIRNWDKKIPDFQTLLEYLKENYYYQNRKVVLTEEFCMFAFHKLAKTDRWISSKSGRPLKELKTAIHYLALDYIKTGGQIRRAEESERKKDMEAKFELKTTEYSQQTSTDLASLERKRRRAAEKAAEAKIKEGKL